MQLKKHLSDGSKVRRLCWILALANIVAASLMMQAAAKFSDRNLPFGMRSPGLAMELVHRVADVYKILGDPSDRSEVAVKDRNAILRLQMLDRWLFIPAYSLFFTALGWYAFIELRKTSLSGPLVAALVLAATILDYVEDYRIVHIVQNLDQGLSEMDVRAVSTVSYPKWGLLFVMLLSLCPLFFRRWPESAALRILGFITGCYIGFSAVAGVFACVITHAGRVESAASAFAAPVLFFFPFVAFFYHGTLEGLDRTAVAFRSLEVLGKKPFGWIVDWPEYGRNAKQRSSTVVGNRKEN